MTRFHLRRNLRTLVYLAVFGLFVAAAGFLWWANHTGLPASWRGKVESELAKQGINASVGSLSLNLLRGIVARDVVLYTAPDRSHAFCKLDRLIINVDKTRIARGDIVVTRVDLADATMDLPIAPQTGPPDTLEVRDLSGSLVMPGGRIIELRDAHATVAGIRVALGARLLKYRPTGLLQTEDTGKEGRLIAITHVLRELRAWKFDPASPPALRCFIEGDLADWSTLSLRMAFRSRSITKNGHTLRDVAADGTYVNGHLSLSSVHAKDGPGQFDGRMDYDVWGREGQFDLTSSVALPEALRFWVGWPLPDQFVFAGSQTVETEGTFKFQSGGPPVVELTGHARCGRVTFKGVPFERGETAFSWRDGSLYLRDLALERGDGKITGKTMIHWPEVRATLRTTLPAAACKPFFTGQAFESVLNDLGELPGGKVDINLDGGFDATDHDSWHWSGKGKFNNYTFRGVPVDEAESDFALSHQEIGFSNIRAVFNFQNYALRKAAGGPASGTLTAGSIRFDGPSKTVAVTQLEGSSWPAPVIRTFSPHIADMLEIYRFRRPPVLGASGIVDTTPQERTRLTVNFKTAQNADYELLGKPVVIEHPSGRVFINGNKVDVTNLDFGIWGGAASGDIAVHPGNRVACEGQWSDISIRAISDTYGMGISTGGIVTGRANLGFISGKIDTLEGAGLASIENASLFSAPVLGPLSKLLATVLSDRLAGIQHANHAFFTFTLRDGIMRTRDFSTSTSSLSFAGEGAVNLVNRTLDATVRVNAKGLLGLVTLPINGLLQFRGNGPLSKPVWENAPFTAPPPEQENILLRPPRARPVENPQGD